MAAIAALLARDDVLILDTETTGLKSAEVIELALLSTRGEVLLDTLVRPKVMRLNPYAARVHRITLAELADRPTWPEVLPELRRLAERATVLAWNAPFDARMLEATSAAWGLPHPRLLFACAMRLYARARVEPHGAGEKEPRVGKTPGGARRLEHPRVEGRVPGQNGRPLGEAPQFGEHLGPGRSVGELGERDPVNARGVRVEPHHLGPHEGVEQHLAAGAQQGKFDHLGAFEAGRLGVEDEDVVARQKGGDRRQRAALLG